MPNTNNSIRYCDPGNNQTQWILGSSAVTLIVWILVAVAFRAYNRILLYVASRKMIKGNNSKHISFPCLFSKAGIPIGIDYTTGCRGNDCGSTYHNYEMRLRDWAKDLISGQTTSGRVIIVVIFLLSIVSMWLYITDTRWVFKNKVALCDKWPTSSVQAIDVVCNLVFIMHFFIRLISANDKLLFLFEIHSLVDILTIPQSLISIWLARNWIGFRFLRAIRLISLPNILQCLNLIHTGTTIRLLQLVTLFSTLVITTAGFLHMVENTGDPPKYENSQDITYFDAIYFMVVTFTTVGFGDITCKTYTGKAFMCLFILGGLAVFANSMPEIADIINLSKRYHGTYNKRKPHIVLCGHITHETVLNFLADFLHKDRERFNIEIVILDNHEPSLALQQLLKRYLIQLRFFKGSVMNTKDMGRIRLEESECCLVLANKYTDNADSEDASNILRVISIKNYSSNVKVIIQLIQYHNKAYLLNIPNWKMQRGDDVICIAELKLGFIAASSLAPGFSTLMVNLFTVRSYEMNSELPRWQNEYLEGAAMQLYGEYFSNDFMGLTFKDAAVISYKTLHLVLIAIQVDQSVIIYPTQSDFTITVLGTKGYFIAQSSNVAKRAFYYCSTCHRQTQCVRDIVPCNCDLAKETRNKIICTYLRRKSTVVKPSSERRNFNDMMDNYYKSQRSTSLPVATMPTAETTLRAKLSSTSTVQIIKQGSRLFCVGSETEDVFNKNRAFHWTYDVNMDDVTISPDSIPANADMFNDHIIICIFAESMSPLIGLRNFIFPLRSSHISYEKLKPIILLGNIGYLQREWKSLRNFPKLFVYIGSALNRIILRALKIDRCSLCVILSSKNSTNVDDHSLVDKEAILSTLNIKAMQFDEENYRESRVSRIRFGNEIPLITELAIDRNVQFLDHIDQNNPEGEIFMTHSFACGTVFTVSVLDSLMSTAFFNEDALGLIRILLSGCVTLEFEQLLTEGTGLDDRSNVTAVYDKPYHIKLLSLTQSPLSHLTYERHKVYGELFLNALKFLGIICIGIYRRIDIYDPFSESEVINSRPCSRYVVTNPSCNMCLFDSDLIYCLSGDFNKL